MNPLSKLSVLLFACGAHANTVGWLGSEDIEVEPAFLKVIPNTGELFVSTFYNNYGEDPRAPDAVHVYPVDNKDFVGSFSSSNGVQALQMVWPNEVYLDDSVIGLGQEKLNAYSVAGGFIMSGSKSDLEVLIDTKREGESPRFVHFRVSPRSLLNLNKPAWFYHRALWVDMDGDGHKDLLTARSNWSVPPLLTYKGQVVWFRNPGNLGDITEALADAGTEPDLGEWLPSWEEHLIDDGKKMGGGDTNILVRDLDGDGVLEIIVTHFWQNDAGVLVWWDKDPGPNIVVYALKDASVGWGGASYPEEVGRKVVADDIGAPFDIEFHDINGDGVDELLTSNHEEDGSKALVIALEVPDGKAFLTEPWKKHVLAQGFPNRVPKGMSPGQAQAFYPSSSYENQKGPDGSHPKPWVIVAGDGTGAAHLLIPKSVFGIDDWEYEEHILYDTVEDNAEGNAITIGGIAVHRSEECTLLYLPAYEMQRIAIYSGCELESSLDELAAQTASIMARQGRSASTVLTSAIAGASVAFVSLVVVAIVAARRHLKASEGALDTENGSSALEVGALSSENPGFVA